MSVVDEHFDDCTDVDVKLTAKIKIMTHLPNKDEYIQVSESVIPTLWRNRQSTFCFKQF